MGRPVKIAFLGDTTDLTGALNTAETAMDSAAATAATAGDKIDRSFAGVADAADGVASSSSQAAGGLGDLGGALALMPGPLGALGAGMEAAAPAIMGVTGAADLLNLATGKFPALAGIASKASTALAAAQRAVGIAVRFALGPIGLIIIGITAFIAILVTLYKKNEAFRNLVNRVWAAIKVAITAVFIWVRDNVPPIWDRVVSATSAAWAFIQDKVLPRVRAFVAGVKDTFQSMREKVVAVVDGIKDTFNTVVGFFSGIGAKIGRTAGGMWDGIKTSFRGMVNGIIGMWNNLSFGIDIPDKIPGLPGSFSISTPNIPYLAEGGIVNRPTLAVIGEAGPEAVVPLGGRDGLTAQVAGLRADVQALAQAIGAEVGAVINGTAAAAHRKGRR